MGQGFFTVQTMADLSTERISFEQALAALLATYNPESGGGSGTILDTRLTLINMVKAKLDEIVPEGEGVQFSLDTEPDISDPYNLLINAFLDEAAKRVLQLAPIHVLDPVKSDATATADATDNKIGYIALPDNFLRFVSLKMADWKRQVSECLPVTDPRYKLQTSKYTRGGTAKPAAFFGFRTISTVQKRVIEYYSVNDSHTIDWLYYIQETAAEDLQSSLTPALTYICAGMVLQASERLDLAKACYEQGINSFQNL